MRDVSHTQDVGYGCVRGHAAENNGRKANHDYLFLVRFIFLMAFMFISFELWFTSLMRKDDESGVTKNTPKAFAISAQGWSASDNFGSSSIYLVQP
jgi:hypothetical protein